MITYDEFAKMELRVGIVLEAEEVEGSEKLIKLKVDLGPKSVILANEVRPESDVRPEDSALRDSGVADAPQNDIRQILTGVKQWYSPADFVGKQVIVVANLAPRMMMGLESQGMMLAANSENGPVLLTVQRPVAPGATIR